MKKILAAIIIAVPGWMALPAPVQAQPPPAWLISAGAITRLETAATPARVAGWLDRPSTIILTGTAVPPAEAGWVSRFAADTKNLGQIAATLPVLPARIGMILYDPEKWTFTPLWEQRNPGPAAADAGTAAAASGRQLIVTPATNLAPSPAWFLAAGVLAAVAPHAQVVEIQAQGLERNTGAYRAFVYDAVNQIRAVNPSAVIYAGLSSNPSGGPVTLTELLIDVTLTRSLVAGYWLNIPSPGPDCPACNPADPSLAAALLRAVG